MKSILRRVLVVNVTEPDQFVATICSLGELISAEKNISLIVIDSFSLFTKFFGTTTDDESFEHVKIVSELLTQLQILAYEFKIAIVITNDFTTKILPNQQNFYTPSLGDVFYHRVGQRLILGRKPLSNVFYATLDKSLLRRSKTIEIKV